MVLRSLSLAIAMLLLVVTLPVGAVVAGNQKPRPPEQPEEGPGSPSAEFSGVRTEQVASGATGYWLLVPTDANAEPVLDESLPLVIFLHGFAALDPTSYGAWLEHIVRRGAIVVYPTYQSEDRPIGVGDQYLPNVRTGLRTALDALAAEHPDAVDPNRVAVAGHSAGGLLAVQYALTAAGEDLPVPTALMTMTPGGCGECGSLAAILDMPSDLPGALVPETLALLFEVVDDRVVGDGAGRRIWRTLTQLPEDQRDHVVLASDDYGNPPLVAEHNTPQTFESGQLNALDYWSTWKLFDALMSCSFDDEDCAYALGRGEAQTSMGDWSDGQPVVPLTVTDDF